MTVTKSSRSELTRERILSVAAETMSKVGFRAMGLNDVLEKLEMSKGALYHHFKNKLELGYAVLDEFYADQFRDRWLVPSESNNQLEALIQSFRNMSKGMTMEELRSGCPINNLAVEMSNIDEGFRKRLERIYTRWEKQMAEMFIDAQKRGMMKDDVDVDELANFIIASTQGAICLTKNTQNIEMFSNVCNSIANYLSHLQIDTDKN